MEEIITKILCGGKRYDTLNISKDTDYLVIVKDDIEFKRVYDESTKTDNLLYGEKFLKKILSGEVYHYNSAFVLLDLCNQNEYDKYDIFSNLDFVKNTYRKWITADDYNLLTNPYKIRTVFYAFVLMYYVENNGYFLTDIQQHYVNSVHRNCQIPNSEIDKLISFYDLKNISERHLRLIKNHRNLDLFLNQLEVIKKKKLEDSLRNKRVSLLKAFDIWEKSVLRGREEDSQEIMQWYKDICDLKEEAFENIPERIQHHLQA